MLFCITIFELLLSIYWLISAVFFYSAGQIKVNCITGFVFTLFTVFIQVFEWVFFAFSLDNLLRLAIDPIAELAFKNRFKIYLISASVLAVVFTFTVFNSGVFGISVRI